MLRKGAAQSWDPNCCEDGMGQLVLVSQKVIMSVKKKKKKNHSMHFKDSYVFVKNWSFYHHGMSFFISGIFLALKSVLL